MEQWWHAGAFIPGKGLHQYESFDELVAANNPALQTFKGGKKTKGPFDLFGLVGSATPWSKFSL